MQINSCWVEKLTKYGITKTDLQYNPCINVAVDTWILAQSIASGKDLWHGVGNYNSQTICFNRRYREKAQRLHELVLNIIHPKKAQTYIN